MYGIYYEDIYGLKYKYTVDSTHKLEEVPLVLLDSHTLYIS